MAPRSRHPCGMTLVIPLWHNVHGMHPRTSIVPRRGTQFAPRAHGSSAELPKPCCQKLLKLHALSAKPSFSPICPYYRRHLEAETGRPPLATCACRPVLPKRLRNVVLPPGDANTRWPSTQRATMAKAIAQSTLTNQALPVNLRIDNKPACPLSNRSSMQIVGQQAWQL